MKTLTELSAPPLRFPGTACITPERFRASLRDLPALPAAVVDIIETLGRDDISAAEVAFHLSHDPALSAKTLRLTNSSFYGMSRQIGSIPDAITILGLRIVRTMVLAAAVTGSFQAAACSNFNLQAFWRHAMGCALFGQSLARELHMDTDIGFTVGLLHDIGRVALASLFPDDYTMALSHQHAHDVLLIDAERATLGTDHAEMGGLLAEHWHFSPVVVEAITHHHAPALHHGPGLVGLTHLADAFSHALGLSGQDSEMVPPTPPEIWGAMAPGAQVCMRLFAQVEHEFEDICQTLHA